MSRKVYVVRYGCYSDQGISCVFSSKKEAEKYCEIKNEIDPGEDYWVDERVLNANAYPKDVQIVDVWEAEVYKPTGEVSVCESPSREIYTKDTIVSGMDSEYLWITVETVKGPEYAKKIAIEKYQTYTQQKLENGEI